MFAAFPPSRPSGWSNGAGTAPTGGDHGLQLALLSGGLTIARLNARHKPPERRSVSLSRSFGPEQSSRCALKPGGAQRRGTMDLFRQGGIGGQRIADKGQIVQHLRHRIEMLQVARRLG